MENAPNLSTFIGRLDYVREACKCPSERAFADWIGLKSQAVLTNWKARGNFGKGGAALHRKTGVSIDWLRDGTGVAFPAGAKVYDGPALADPERLDEIERAIMGIVSAMAGSMPDAAAGMSRAWRGDDKDRLKGLLQILAGTIDAQIAEARKGNRGKRSRD